MKGKRDEMNVDQGKSWTQSRSRHRHRSRPTRTSWKNRIEEEAKIKIGNEEEKWISGERQRMRIEKKEQNDQECNL